jgi:hypothetical protein
VRACFRLSSASRSSGSASVAEPTSSEEQEGRRVLLNEPLPGVSAGGGVSLTDDPHDAGVATSCVELSPAR